MGSRVLRVAVALAVSALTVTAGASSRPDAGVTVTPRRPVALPYFTGNSITAYILVASATWSPPTIRTEGAINIYSCAAVQGGRACRREGGPRVMSFGNGGVVLHTSEDHGGLFAAAPGDRLEIVAKWRAYNPVQPPATFDGEATSQPLTLNVPEGLPPRFSEATKLQLSDSSVLMYASCESLTLTGGGGAIVPGLGEPAREVGRLSCASGLGANQMAFDPVDPSFRSLVKVKIPTVLKVTASGAITAPAAAAFNRLLAAQAKGVGYGRAVLTSINRAQGANAKKQKAWEERQMRAAGKFAMPLAAALLDEVKQRAAVAGALKGRAFAGVVITEEAFDAFQDSVIRNGLPPATASGLSRAGISKADQQLIAGWLLATDASRVVGNPLAGIADPKLATSLRKSAAALKAFAKKAAKSPLSTST